MACPVCPTAGWLGGWLGGYVGIDPPQRPGGKLFSALITANLITITLIALKSLFDFSLCKDGRFTFENVARVILFTIPMGVVYSIGVNYLLNNYVFPSDCDEPLVEDEPPHCCCNNK